MKKGMCVRISKLLIYTFFANIRMISLYQKNIESVCSDEVEMELRIREVLFHELGHYFGMNEAQVRSAMKRFL